jgi:RES domain
VQPGRDSGGREFASHGALSHGSPASGIEEGRGSPDPPLRGARSRSEWTARTLIGDRGPSDTQARMILVLDNATYHHAVLLHPPLKAYRRHLGCCIYRRILHSSRRSSASGNSLGAWRRKTALVHFNRGELPPQLVVAKLRIPENVSREVLSADRIPAWRAAQSNVACQEFGDRWYDARRSAVLVAPSVLSPFECNVLINQPHPESRSIEVSEVKPAVLDERLLGLLRRS